MPGATEPASRWFVLPNVTIELVQSTSELSLIRGWCFALMVPPVGRPLLPIASGWIFN